MDNFTIYPAIDLRQGQVVRLQYGDPERQTLFDDDPLAVADRWIKAGAAWLHVVNLDGAFAPGAGNANWQLLPQLAQRGARIQFGGGIRELADIERALSAGVTRVILGTVAVENPDLVATAGRHFGTEALVIAIDARDGQVRTRGWQAEGGLSALALALRMHDLGVSRALHTDIGRDGVLTGVNAAASADLARESGLAIIASGGVAGPEDVRAAVGYQDAGVDGVIIGRALYDGKLDLAEALALARATKPI